MKVSELFEESNLNTKVEVDGKVYDAIYINDWTTADLKAAAEECRVSLKGPVGSAKQSIMRSGRHYLIRNYTEHGGDRTYKRYFTTPAFVKSYKVKKEMAEAKEDTYPIIDTEHNTRLFDRHLVDAVKEYCPDFDKMSELEQIEAQLHFIAPPPRRDVSVEDELAAVTRRAKSLQAKIQRPVKEAFILEAGFTKKPDNVIGHIFSSKQFTFKNNCFSAEDSDLDGKAFNRLWNDAADLGFGIKSEKTGNIVFFTKGRTFKDAEGDTTHWDFKPYNPKREPEIAKLSATIFND